MFTIHERELLMKTPSGNAVKGASTRPVRYPVQLVIMLSDDAAAYVQAAAVNRLERGVPVSKSQAARSLIEDGIKLNMLAVEYGVSVEQLLKIVLGARLSLRP